MNRRPAKRAPLKPCPGCRRMVAYKTAAQRRYGGGKGRVKHKCPHGRWCVFGERHGREGWNWPTCPECLKVEREMYWKERGGRA